MAKFGNNYIRVLIHKTGLAAQHKHDAVLNEIFAGSPTDRQHLIHAHAFINSLDVDADTKRFYWESLINYSSTGDRDAASRGIYAHAYVQAVNALDRALTPIWRADQTLLNLITQIIKIHVARINYTAFKVKQTITNHLPPFKFLDSLLTKTMPAHAPTAMRWDAA
jgi:hypothetical protein